MVKRTGRKSRTTRRGSKRTTRATSRGRTRNVRQQSKGRSKATRRTYGRKRKRNIKKIKKKGGGNVGYDVTENPALQESMATRFLSNNAAIEDDTTLKWKYPIRNVPIGQPHMFDGPNGQWVMEQLNSDKPIDVIKKLLIKTGNLIKV